MKKLLLACIFSIFSCCLYGQTVQGVVYRGSGDTVVANAVVYYSGSMNGGTQTDEKGRFGLLARPVQIPVVASCVGYYSSTVYYKPGEPLIIRLKPKQEQLPEVTITVDGMKRENEVELFKQEFLGTSVYAQSCTITNIDAVNLHYNKRTRVLTASCYEPILIENKKLGYTIFYYLNKFERNPKMVSMAGTYIFKDNVLPTDKNYKKVQNNREDAYQGSRMQFIRALWNHRLDETIFNIYTPFFDKLTQDNIVVQDPSGQRYVHLNNRIFVTNANDVRQVSPLTQQEKYTFIDQDGFFGEGLLWAGIMGVQRMGDLLPFEYRSAYEYGADRSMAQQLVQLSKPVKQKEIFADDVPDSKKLSPADKKAVIFKRMVLTPVSPINDTLVVKKWQRPVRYKMYGSTGDKDHDASIATNLKELFGLMTASASFSMEEAATDSAVNLSILVGKLPELKDHLNAEAMEYFSRDADRSGYYTCTTDGFQNMVQLINTDKVVDHANIKAAGLIWEQLRMQLMAGLGFFGQLGYDRENKASVFNRKPYWQPEMGLQPFDKYLIRSLYHPLVRSGMQETELDGAIKAMGL